MKWVYNKRPDASRWFILTWNCLHSRINRRRRLNTTTLVCMRHVREEEAARNMCDAGWFTLNLSQSESTTNTFSVLTGEIVSRRPLVAAVIMTGAKEEVRCCSRNTMKVLVWKTVGWINVHQWVKQTQDFHPGGRRAERTSRIYQ